MIDVNLLYPIGSIYMSIQSTNPSTFFGGTWERIAKGKTLVGVDETDSDFNASSKTGGEKTHILLHDELPKIRYFKGDVDNYDYNNSLNVSLPNGTTYSLKYPNVGKNTPHNNLQPYYTCYIFVRTA